MPSYRSPFEEVQFWQLPSRTAGRLSMIPSYSRYIAGHGQPVGTPLGAVFVHTKLSPIPWPVSVIFIGAKRKTRSSVSPSQLLATSVPSTRTYGPFERVNVVAGLEVLSDNHAL